MDAAGPNPLLKKQIKINKTVIHFGTCWKLEVSTWWGQGSGHRAFLVCPSSFYFHTPMGFYWRGVSRFRSRQTCTSLRICPFSNDVFGKKRFSKTPEGCILSPQDLFSLLFSLVMSWSGWRVCKIAQRTCRMKLWNSTPRIHSWTCNFIRCLV